MWSCCCFMKISMFLGLVSYQDMKHILCFFQNSSSKLQHKPRAWCSSLRPLSTQKAPKQGFSWKHPLRWGCSHSSGADAWCGVFTAGVYMCGCPRWNLHLENKTALCPAGKGQWCFCKVIHFFPMETFPDTFILFPSGKMTWRHHQTGLGWITT